MAMVSTMTKPATRFATISDNWLEILDADVFSSSFPRSARPLKTLTNLRSFTTLITRTSLSKRTSLVSRAARAPIRDAREARSTVALESDMLGNKKHMSKTSEQVPRRSIQKKNPMR
jgi:hypothetical protein